MLLWNRLRGWLWVLVASAVLGGGSVLVAQAGRAAPDNDSAAAGQRVAAEDSKAGRLDKAPDRGPGHKPRGRLSGYTFVLDRIDVRRRLITTHIKGGELNTGDLEPIKWNVAPDAEIIIACKPARLADLRAGMVVRLTLDREDPPADTLGTVYKIEVAADGKASRPATAGEEGNHIDIKTASLDAVDVKHRRISVSIGPKPTLGGKLQDAEGNPLGERPTKLVDLPVAADADITISLRDLPSVGNHVQRQLGELAKLKVGTPVSLRLAQRDGKPVVSKITVWRD